MNMYNKLQFEIKKKRGFAMVNFGKIESELSFYYLDEVDL